MHPTRFRPAAISAMLVGLLSLTLMTVGIVGFSADSSAQSPTCPDGTKLSVDGSTCISNAIDENITVTQVCTEGVLTDGVCVVPRLDAAPVAPAAQAETQGGGALNAPVPSFTG